MPIDAEPVPDGNILLAPGDPPTVLLIRPGDQVAEGLLRFTSHFATCPDAAQHRRHR